MLFVCLPVWYSGSKALFFISSYIHRGMLARILHRIFHRELNTSSHSAGKTDANLGSLKLVWEFSFPFRGKMFRSSKKFSYRAWRRALWLAAIGAGPAPLENPRENQTKPNKPNVHFCTFFTTTSPRDITFSAPFSVLPGLLLRDGALLIRNTISVCWGFAAVGAIWMLQLFGTAYSQRSTQMRIIAVRLR